MTKSADRNPCLIVENAIFLNRPEKKSGARFTLPQSDREWLMKNDFQAESWNHKFILLAPTGAARLSVHGREPKRRLLNNVAAYVLESVRHWTLRRPHGNPFWPHGAIGGRQDQESAYPGAQFGWQNSLLTLSQVLRRGA